MQAKNEINLINPNGCHRLVNQPVLFSFQLLVWYVNGRANTSSHFEINTPYEPIQNVTI